MFEKSNCHLGVSYTSCIHLYPNFRHTQYMAYWHTFGHISWGCCPGSTPRHEQIKHPPYRHENWVGDLHIGTIEWGCLTRTGRKADEIGASSARIPSWFTCPALWTTLIAQYDMMLGCGWILLGSGSLRSWNMASWEILYKCFFFFLTGDPPAPTSLAMGFTPWRPLQWKGPLHHRFPQVAQLRLGVLSAYF